MFVIDRFEENWAVIEYNNTTFNVPREMLPKDAREGDIINITVSINPQAVTEYQEDIDTLVSETFE